MPLDPSLYSWQKFSPSLWHRRALASERMWIARPKDLHELFISGTLRLETLVGTSELQSAAENAWRRVRFDFPELMVKGVCLDGETYMRYQRLEGEEEVSEWIQRTARFDQGREILDFEGLREKVLLKEQAFDSEPAYLLLYSELESGDSPGVSRFHVMLNLDHEITDGIGARILFGKFLSLLASCLSNPDDAPEVIDWEKCTDNLSKPWITIMNDEQLLSGPDYEEKVQWNKTMLLDKMTQNPGLSLLNPPASPSQRTHFITLSPYQTNSLLAATKTLSSNSNLTHLTHAAVTLAFLHSIPLNFIPSTFYSSCWLNGRRCLLPSEQAKGYIPCCLSFAPINFPNLRELVLEKGASKEEVKEKLVKASEVATKESMKIRERKSVLSEIVSVVEEIGDSMASAKDSDASTARPSKAAPLFLSNGITEQYIEHEYFGSGRRVFEVEDVKFAANADTELIVRMSSWRGRTTISGEWNARDYDEETIKGILSDVVDIMLSICE